MTKTLYNIYKEAIGRYDKILSDVKKKRLKEMIRPARENKVDKGKNIFIEPVKIRENVFIRKR